MPDEATILSVGGYIPRTRIARETIAEIWGSAAVPGERAVGGPDEDALTMGVEAARSCVGRSDGKVDAVYFASTTAPYAEHQSAAIIAAALDLPTEITTIDFGGTLRAGTSALRAARDAIVSGTASRVLVVAADRRPAEPETVYEQLYGDGAAALLIGGDEPGGLARIDALESISDDVSAGWRRSGDPHVRSHNPKHEVKFGFSAPLVSVLTSLISGQKLDVSRTWLALPSPDGTSHLKIARSLGIAPDHVADPLSQQIGVLGCPAAFIALIGALRSAGIGDRVVMGAAGEGADGLSLEVLADLPADSWDPTRLHEEPRVVATYGDFIRANKLMDLAGPVIPSSPVQFWRDRKQFLNLRGMRCLECGLVQYPIGRCCQRCSTKDRSEEQPLLRRGTVFSYTGDHIVASTYSTRPVVRAIVDLDGGGRILTSIVDCTLDDVDVGMAVELVFRRSHEGGDFMNYYWKARPLRSELQGSVA